VGDTGKVVGIEHIEELVKWSIDNVRRVPGLASRLDDGRIKIVAGDGRKGYSTAAPFDAIHVGAAAPELPPAVRDYKLSLITICYLFTVTNAEISTCTGLPPVMDFVRRRCLSVFCHIARLTQGTPAHNALHCQVGLSSGRSLGGIGDIVLVVLTLAGQTNSATTLDLFLPTAGDRPFYGVMVERQPELAMRWRRLIHCKKLYFQCISVSRHNITHCILYHR